MNILIYIISAAVGLFFSFVFLIFSMTGGRSTSDSILGLLIVAHIASVAFVAWKANKGTGSSVALILIFPAFFVTAGMWLFLIGRHLLSYVHPDSPEFASECRTAGPHYFQPPSSLVKSIAIIIDGKYEPTFNSFKLGLGHHISSLNMSNHPYPDSIEFIERGRQGGKFEHFSRLRGSYKVDALSADVLVKYKFTPEEELRKAPTNQGMVSYELSVIDQRNGENLAYLKYVIDAKNNRACGVVVDKTMSEQAFVLKAIGLR
jgi:hypothetical protein